MHKVMMGSVVNLALLAQTVRHVYGDTSLGVRRAVDRWNCCSTGTLFARPSDCIDDSHVRNDHKCMPK